MGRWNRFSGCLAHSTPLILNNESIRLKIIVSAKGSAIQESPVVEAAASEADLSWDEVRPRLVQMMRPNNWVNVFYILGEYLMLAVALWASGWLWFAWAGDELPTSAFVSVAVLMVVVIGALQHRLSGMGHEASHFALFRNRLANDLASDWLLMFPVAAITRQFRLSHADHHRFVNDPERDPDAVRLRNKVAGAFPMPKPGFWRRYVWGNVWPLPLWAYIMRQAANANFAGAGRSDLGPYPLWAARVMRTIYWLILATIVTQFALWPVLLVFWIAPLLTSFPFFMQLREIAHHSNAPGNGHLTNTRVFEVGRLLRFSVFPYGQNFHLTHHIFATLPHYRATKAHQLLLRYRPYRDHAVVCRGFFFRRGEGPSVLDVLSRTPILEGLPGPHIARP